ncbi:MAG: NAD+ synthase [Bacteroidetes bacterium GWC2_33_15]|nr:MAG: NAD+ synthase [Bacteroidetes bacterium GWA2_33_15]OFX50458.1 MAG: NAD+ synthase [Bacteroidetes bacterium GWC2_33_15]OFX66624.1 MAG: NAD+ synthase [Bacteroidetes bacterium GWB2_32_14]OFX69242.1 MAG: NAD+ synthase [Bacteroidetes bacterium GWD2_33_33]HAN18554.1 NAD+ synthase [Bacteroidales bacterium]
MKIALAQLNYHIGNFERNTAKIVEKIEEAKNDSVDLIVFSEMSVCGYPPQDLLEKKSFIDHCQEAVDEIVSNTKNIAVIIGSPTVNFHPKGKKLHNSALFIHDGEIQFIQHKTLLPTYDIFDEYRYFEPNDKFNVIEYKGEKIAITICEDLWDEQPVSNTFARNQLYTVTPMEKLIEHKPDFVINIAASPFSYTKIWGRKNIFIRNSKKYKLPIFNVNQVGAQTELIFDGGSMVINSDGTIADELKLFAEDYKVYNLEEIKRKKLKKHINEDPYVIAKIHDALVLGIRDYFKKVNLTKATLGLSGGIDSAVALAIASEALGHENMRVLLLPSKFSSDHSIADAVKLAENLGVRYDIINIQDVVDNFNKSLQTIFKGLKEDITEENIQARARGTILMALSNKFGHILLNTSNKSESAVGYGTLYGDMAGGLSVLGDVYKTDVYKLAQYINREKEIIPLHSIQKAPSAELRPDQKDSDSLPEYEVLDKILFEYIELQKTPDEIISEGWEKSVVERIIKLVDSNEFKRYQAPPILRISSKAFGAGRRIPLVAKLY